MPHACPRKMVTHHPFLSSPSPEWCGMQMLPGGIPRLCWVFMAHRCSIVVDPTIALPWSVSSPGFDMAKMWCHQQMALNPWKRQMGTVCLYKSHLYLSLKTSYQLQFWRMTPNTPYKCFIVVNLDCSGCSCSSSMLDPLRSPSLSKFPGQSFQRCAKQHIWISHLLFSLTPHLYIVKQ